MTHTHLTRFHVQFCSCEKHSILKGQNSGRCYIRFCHHTLCAKRKNKDIMICLVTMWSWMLTSPIKTWSFLFINNIFANWICWFHHEKSGVFSRKARQTFLPTLSWVPWREKWVWVLSEICVTFIKSVYLRSRCPICKWNQSPSLLLKRCFQIWIFLN